MITQLLALFEGKAEPQTQSLTDTPDREVTWSYKGDSPLSVATLTATDTDEATELPVQPGTTVLRLNRVLRPGPVDLPEGAKGHVTGHWSLTDDIPARAVFAVLR